MVFKKLFMAAAFLDFAFIHVEDAGTVLDGGKAVGDDKGGTSFKKLVQAFLQDDFCLRIDAGGRFIQYQDFGIGQQGTGEGNQLSLSGGQAASSFIYLGMVAILHLHDEVMGTNGFGGTDNLFIRGGTVSVTDIIHDGAGKDKAVLHHDAHLGTQGMKSDLGYIGIINPDSAAADVVETAEQVDDGGFAGV